MIYTVRYNRNTKAYDVMTLDHSRLVSSHTLSRDADREARILNMRGGEVQKPAKTKIKLTKKEKLDKFVARCSSKKEAADALGIGTNYLYAVLSGKRPVSENIRLKVKELR